MQQWDVSRDYNYRWEVEHETESKSKTWNQIDPAKKAASSGGRPGAQSTSILYQITAQAGQGFGSLTLLDFNLTTFQIAMETFIPLSSDTASQGVDEQM